MRIYIEGMKELPKSCQVCQIRRLAGSLYQGRRACPIINGDRTIPNTGRNPYCPLREQRQPNRFNSVVQLLMDADLRKEDDFLEEEEYIKMLAEMICQMFKDGPYDKEEDMTILTKKEEDDLKEILEDHDRLKEENKMLLKRLSCMINDPGENDGTKDKNHEIKIKVKAEGFEEAEEGIRKISDALDSFPGMIKIQKLENCEVNFHMSQFYSGGSEDE